MTRQRLSREQSREQTRQRYLDAAREIFTQKGFVAASVEDISEAAGYSRGAFYSNFNDKTELFLALLRASHADITLEFDRIFEMAPADPAVLKAALAHYYSQLYCDDICSVLWVEAKLVASRDLVFRSKLNVLLAEKRAEVAHFIERFARHTGLPPLASPDLLAVGLMALVDGVSSMHRTDPQQVGNAIAEATLAWFFNASVFGAGAAAPGSVPADSAASPAASR